MRLLRTFYLVLIIIMTLCTSCSSHLPLQLDNSNGRFPESTKLNEKDISVSVKTKGLPSYNFLTLRTYYNGSYRINSRANKLIKDAFSKIGFNKILETREFRALAEKFTPEIQIDNINDIRVLHKISKRIGRYLVAEIHVDNAGSDRRRFNIVLVDPYIGKVVFNAEITTIVWLSYQKELYYPVLNAVLDWYNKQKFQLNNDKFAI